MLLATTLRKTVLLRRLNDNSAGLDPSRGCCADDDDDDDDDDLGKHIILTVMNACSIINHMVL